MGRPPVARDFNPGRAKDADAPEKRRRAAPARCHPNRAGCSGRGAAGRSAAPAAHAESQDKAAESLRSFLPSFPWGVLWHALLLSILSYRQNVLLIDPAS